VSLQPVHQFVLIIKDPATDFDPWRTNFSCVPSEQGSLIDPEFRNNASLADQPLPANDDLVTIGSYCGNYWRRDMDYLSGVERAIRPGKRGDLIVGRSRRIGRWRN
jgi:hypothetical protein